MIGAPPRASGGDMRIVSKSLGIAALLFLSACGGGEDAKQKGRPSPLVKVEAPRSMRFVERIDAVGTAVANEQVTLSAPVTERIVRLGFDDGAFVRRGQVLAVLAQGQENAELSEANARAREAEQQLARVEALRNRGFATKSSLDTQAALAAQARAQAAGARATIGDRVVTAPFAGYVSLRNISAGAIVTAGTEIATVSDISLIKLDFTVPETMIGALKAGQAIEARAAAFPDQPFRGQIATIDPVIDPDSRAVTVRARLPNPDQKLKPGMLLTVGVETSPRMALSVPELAILGEGDTRYVYVVGDDRKAKRVNIKTGVRSNGRIEVVEGLRPNQRVVTEGVVKLSDGIEVQLAGAEGAQPKGGAQGKAP